MTLEACDVLLFCLASAAVVDADDVEDAPVDDFPGPSWICQRSGEFGADRFSERL